ncbi:hypothetical protein [Cupriavidus sp. IK-TO18]|uniref:hypothetical protein n=1 Tax=Cupriavidus sp. IK-TO18 TaxID=2782182 RepID=UPI00189B34CC|nr:hypothetical protein [Cupriavidus sp. IK-TO18]MBF6987232.1 hypothetical protein [Cupriavidus sp. IK-TO18]
MESSFQIIEPKAVTLGDFLSFTIIDGDKRIPGRISRTALAVLDSTRTGDDLAVFAVNEERIREAAYKMRRVNPHLDLIALGTLNF